MALQINLISHWHSFRSGPVKSIVMTATDDYGSTIFSDRFAVTLVLHETLEAIIRLTDQHGKIVRMYGTQLKKGLNHFELEHLGDLPKGGYRLDIISTDGASLFQGEFEKV